MVVQSKQATFGQVKYALSAGVSSMTIEPIWVRSSTRGIHSVVDNRRHMLQYWFNHIIMMPREAKVWGEITLLFPHAG